MCDTPAPWLEVPAGATVTSWQVAASNVAPWPGLNSLGALPAKPVSPVPRSAAPPDPFPHSFLRSIRLTLHLGQQEPCPMEPWHCTWATSPLPPGLALLPASPMLQAALPTSTPKRKARVPVSSLQETAQQSQRTGLVTRNTKSPTARTNTIGFLCNPMYFILWILNHYSEKRSP